MSTTEPGWWRGKIKGESRRELAGGKKLDMLAGGNDGDRWDPVTSASPYGE